LLRSRRRSFGERKRINNNSKPSRWIAKSEEGEGFHIIVNFRG
jgi:hypothetical protein